MIRFSPLLAALAVCIAMANQGNDKSTTVEGHWATGRNLEAYESAANYLRTMKPDKNGNWDIPEKWSKIENYSIRFEGEKDGIYIMHFVPENDPNLPPTLGFNPKYGIPVRFYVRKSDLKVLKAVRE